MGDFLRAAYEVLKAESRPLTSREITGMARTGGLLRTRGKTPAQTMKSKLSTDILSKKERSVFMRTESGRFGLREWGSVLSEYVADRFQKALYDEDIIVIPQNSLHKYVPGPGLFTGPVASQSLRSECFSMRRQLAEEDPSVIQIVSVFLLKFRDLYLTYKRTKRLPEARLHGFYSVVFGGHLNPNDIPSLFDIFIPDQGLPFLSRELEEEVRLRGGVENMSYRGLLYDDSQPVSRQHLGVVYNVRLRSEKYTIGERGFLMDSKFETLGEIVSRLDAFENWSVLLVRDEEKLHRENRNL